MIPSAGAGELRFGWASMPSLPPAMSMSSKIEGNFAAKSFANTAIRLTSERTTAEINIAVMIHIKTRFACSCSNA